MTLAEVILKEFDSKGLFSQLRARNFVLDEAEDFVTRLLRIDLEERSMAEKMGFLSEIWLLPFLASTYQERCILNGAASAEYARFSVALFSAVENRIAEIVACISD